jgi:hypothetical protein
VKTNLNVIGLEPEHVPTLREVRGRHVNAERPPSTRVGADWLIEIDALVVTPG